MQVADSMWQLCFVCKGREGGNGQAQGVFYYTLDPPPPTTHSMMNEPAEATFDGGLLCTSEWSRRVIVVIASGAFDLAGWLLLSVATE